MKKTLLLCVFMIFVLTACTFKHTIPIRYTPIIQMEKLATKGAPETVQLGDFTDERKDPSLFSKHLNPISVHKIKGEIAGDLLQTVRNAFVDGFLKSGYEVPMGAEAGATPLFVVTGRIKTYNVSIKTAWSKVAMTGFVDVELTLKRDDGQELILMASGTNEAVSKGSISYDSAGSVLDLATQECVKNFFANPKFHEFLKK